MPGYTVYMETCIKLSWLVDAVENFLQSQPDGSIINLRKLRSGVVVSRVPSDAQLLEVLKTVERLNIIDDNHRLNKRILSESKEFRKGLRSGITFSQQTIVSTDERIELCVTPPHGAEEKYDMFRDVPNLFYAISDLIAASKRHIVVCSPFWDESIAEGVVELLERRLLDGVKVDLLIRDLEDKLVASRILSLKKKYVGCNVYRWRRLHDNGKYSTFHFKAIVVDGGEKAYLGSANMTESSMKHSMELGLIVSGKVARTLSHLVDIMLSTLKEADDT